mmetsp:Transcript_12815/g.36827  ORF Transcript_12815/g.36827 Transcript_12815/m.36827 type:complete len:680 (+) Transcript_12815:162-2201(+)
MTRHRSHHQDAQAAQKLYYEKLADEVISRSAKVLDAKEDEWEWGDYVAIHDESIRVSLAGVGVRDADLESLCTYLLRSWKETYAKSFPNGCDLTVDLSCNCGISDYGIIVHLVPFLKRWPTCRRLKLYQTSVGDRALEALTPWITKGHAHELHFSDLFGEVSSDAVLQLLMAIHKAGRYPYWKPNGGKAPLWLRLEHNRLPSPEDLVDKAVASGASIRILGRSELSAVRPADDLRKRGQDNPEVILVLFRLQQRKELVQDECVEQTRDLLSLLGKTVGSGGISGDADDHNGKGDSRLARRRGRAGSKGGGSSGLPASEPQPLSVDEFRLWEMQAREDEECGADERNWETFGADVGKGWSFEENVKANAWLARRAARAAREWRRWEQQGWGSQMQMQMAYGDQTGMEPGFWADDASGYGACGSQMDYGCGAACSVSASNGSRVQVAKTEVDEAITRALYLIPTLQRADFDGQVKQYLHAIRTRGGSGRVFEAIQAIHTAMNGKTRSSVRRWPAYLVALLKRFLADITKPVSVPATPVAPVTPVGSTANTGMLSTNGDMYIVMDGGSASAASSSAVATAASTICASANGVSATAAAAKSAAAESIATKPVASADARADSAAATSAHSGAAAEKVQPCSSEVANSVEPSATENGLERGVACGAEADAREISAEIMSRHGRLQ